MSLRYSKVGSHIRLLFVTLPLLSLLFAEALILGPARASAKTSGSQAWTVVAGMESSNFAIQGAFYAPSDIYVHQGDTLKWVVQSHDIHTVTFLAKGQTLPPFNPSDPTQVTPQGGSTYDGSSYFNSGILTLDTTFPGALLTYELVMGVTGRFDYYCLVHGVLMHGGVHVQPVGTELANSQEDVHDQITEAREKMLSEGRDLNEKALHTVAQKHIVLVGIGSMTEVGMVEIVRFFPTKIHVHVGQTLTFVSEGMMPHTFTIGDDQDPLTPVGDASNYAGGVFNRFVPSGSPPFTLKVTAALDLPFLCQFHDTLGMTGELIAA